MKTILNLNLILLFGILMVFSCTKEPIEIEKTEVFRSSKKKGGNGEPGGNTCTNIHYDLNVSIGSNNHYNCFKNCEGESRFIISTSSGPGNTFIQLGIADFVPCSYSSSDFDGKSMVVTPSGNTAVVEYYYKIGNNGYRIEWFGIWRDTNPKFTAEQYRIIRDGKSNSNCWVTPFTDELPVGMSLHINESSVNCP